MRHRSIRLDLSAKGDPAEEIFASYTQRQLVSDPPTPSDESDISSSATPSPIVVGVYGGDGVGKNTFLRGSRLTDRNGSRARVRTMEVDGRRVRFEVMSDLAANPHVYLVLFDLTRGHTLSQARAIVEQIRERRRPSLDDAVWWQLKTFPIILVGNKMDQASSLVSITSEMAEMVSQTGIADSVLVSVRRKDNVELLYRNIARLRWSCEDAVNRQLLLPHGRPLSRRQSVALGTDTRKSASAIVLSEEERKDRCVIS